MREIKFRSWLKIKNEMLYEFTTMNPQTNTENEARVLMQYVGLKDKNGREIYEGDVVEITNHPFDRGEINERWNGKYVVEYEPENMELIISYFPGAHSGWILFRMRHYAEVIGNIYENPELLEASQ